MTKVTLEFLKSFPMGINYDGNIHKISKDVYQFTIYNWLPGKNPHGFDGHYSFAVNITNFKYLCWKDSDYGGLTYVRDNQNKIFIPVHKSMKAEVEAIIAGKLRGAYWYDRDAVFSKGKNLFPNGNPTEPAGHGFNPNIVRYHDGAKYSLICTWVDDYPNEPLGELKDIEKAAIEKLQK
jgi:hypothetical protein